MNVFERYLYIVTYLVQIQNISIVCMMEKTPLTRANGYLNVSCELK